MKGVGQVRPGMSRLRWVTADPTEADKDGEADNDKQPATAPTGLVAAGFAAR